MRRASRAVGALSRQLLIDGVDDSLIEPRSTTGQPDGWGWDWEAWHRPRRVTSEQA